MSTIGSLNIKLGLDVGQFSNGLAGADSALGKFASALQQQFKAIEAQMTRIGVGLTAALTVPFALMSKGAAKTAGDFESAMNRVHAALRPLTPRQLERLKAAALELGPAVGMSATQAAEAIETLGLAGMGVEAILGGGLKQTLVMAKANLGGVEESAGLATDVLRQFNLVSGDLPMIVQQVTGALDTSKFGFADFQLAVAQGGAVAGSAGLSFQEFATAISATSAQFASGSDAGTSFKAFIVGLKGNSDEAKRVIEQLGLKFFDAQGKFLGLGNAAEQLRAKVGVLSDQSKGMALTTLFGTDGMRTAIALMQAGRAELDKIAEAIGKTDVQEKLAIQMQGLNQAFINLSNAAERLKVALGDAGLLAVFTGVTAAIGGMIGFLADLPSGFHTVYLAVGLLAAALGPLILLFTRVIVPIVLTGTSVGILGKAVLFLINPIGFLAIALTGLAVRFGLVGAAANLLAGRFSALMARIFPLIVVATLLFGALTSQATASEDAMRASDAAGAAFGRMSERAMQLANATGKARQQIVALMQAEMMLASIKAGFLRAEAAEDRAAAARMRSRGRVLGGPLRDTIAAGFDADATEKESAAARFESTREAGARALNAPPPAPAVNIPNLGEAPSRTRNKKEKESNAEDIAHRREMLALNQQLAEARAREDQDAERAIQRKIDLKERTKEYRDLEFGAAEAASKAAADMAGIDAAEQFSRKLNLELIAQEIELEAARTIGLSETIQKLEDERWLRDQTLELQREGLSYEEAAEEATRQQIILGQARLDLRRREVREMRAARDLELARLRGDTGRIKELERSAWIDQRARERARIEGRDFNPQADRAAAAAEWAQGEEARLTGLFRDTFRSGVMAALNGDLGGWFSRWWSEQFAKSLESGLNAAADALREALKEFAAENKGGILGRIAGAFGLGKTDETAAPLQSAAVELTGAGATLHSAGGSLAAAAVPLGATAASLTAAAAALAAAGGGAGLAGTVGGVQSGASVGAGLLGSLFGGSKPIDIGTNPSDFFSKVRKAGKLFGKLPKFATGGSFEVGGRAGIDQNLVSFWATRGEMVNVSKGEGRQRGGGAVHFHLQGAVMTQDLVDQMNAIGAGAAAAGARGGSAMTGKRMQRNAARQLPTSGWR